MPDEQIKQVSDVPAETTTTTQRDELIRAIAERVIAQGGTFGETEARAVFASELDKLASDPEVVRKIRFGAAPDLAGSKFAGMADEDVEFLGGLMSSCKNMRMANGELHPGMSPELANALRTVGPKLDAQLPAGYQRTLTDTRMGRVVDPGDARAARAMDTTDTSNYIGAQYVGSLWEAARRTSRVWPLIPTFNMTAPTAYLPVEVDFPVLYYVSESTASNATNWTTSTNTDQRVACSAAMFAMSQMWSGALEEDSIISWVPFLKAQGVKSLAWHQDALVLRGDTTTTASTNINAIDTTPTTTAYGQSWYLAWDGIIHGALVDNTANAIDAGGAPTWEDFMAMKTKMYDRTYFHDWGHPNSPSDLIYVAEPSTADTIALLDEVITVDKYGTGATVFTGEIGNIHRNPLIVCDSLVLTEATGKIDADTLGDNTKGTLVCFNRNGYVLGTRRALKVEVERLPRTDQTAITYTMRHGLTRFTPTGAASGIESCAVLYDITV